MIKKILLSLYLLILAALTISAQSIVGLWKTDEMVNNGVNGTIYYNFEPNGQSLLTVDCRYPVKENAGLDMEIRVYCKVPGLYLAEEGRALTVNYDRNNIDLKFEIVFDENELIKQGLPADQITLFKQEFNKMLIQKGLINQTKQSFLQSLPLSMISQILYNDGKQFVLSYPQGNFWNERHVLYRVSQ